MDKRGQWSWSGALQGGPGDRRCVALTFDDGPEPPFTDEILDQLELTGTPATFFVIGKKAKQWPHLIERMAAAGHIVGNHTQHHRHPYLQPFAARQGIIDGAATIERILGKRPRWLRPPWGLYPAWLWGPTRATGQTPVAWTVEALDFLRPGSEMIAKRIVRAARPGSIILLHDGGGDRSQTVGALPMIISGLRRQGYQFVTLAELIE